MGERTKTINFNKIEPGMRIAKNLEQNGRVLLKQDVLITDQIITKLKKMYYIESVDVYDNETVEKQVSIEDKKQAELSRVEEEFKEISSRLQNTFGQIASKNETSMNEIRDFSQKIQNELTPSSIVIKNIVLYGSGEDSIYRHGVNVAALSSLLGKWIGLEESKIKLLVYSAILHDVGKTKIDTEVLKKYTALTKSEFNIIKTHTSAGYNLIKGITFLDKSVSYGVLMHHERVDGSGYPLGLKGEAIHPFAKIIAIADVFDAINSDRGYKDKKLPFEALQIVKTEGLGKLDYEYVKIFIEHVVGYYTGEEVLLNTDEKCKIIQMNVNNLEKPLVMRDGEFIDLAKEKHLYIKEMLL
ncbi:HD family phosphohydrolase [Clostridium gelidum]|uniref:HD family phosphohydrolase n=1 Tax=Clostridium gelidum TaxID=704125 RepID=A0ABN6IUN7_9CLOT|nr:HD-GYP domain-containing protein [Clostridium gelidum]BCZ45341.1 HD family phosphohydrolase [Clostridium gelidum]